MKSIKFLMTIMLVVLCVVFVSCSSKNEPDLVESPKKVIPAQVGDFYMNDGTWLPGTTTLTNEQMMNCIGIVYWTGDPTENDPALKAAHPTCTHGLVVALNELEMTMWQEPNSSVDAWVVANSNYTSIMSNFDFGTLIDKILGYNNTKAIEAFNADAANSGKKVKVIEQVIAYRKVVPTPVNNSGWFLPSGKELALLCGLENQNSFLFEDKFGNKNRDVINRQLAKITGANQINNDGSYYSSTERNSDIAWTVHFGFASVLPQDKSIACSTRFVSAF